MASFKFLVFIFLTVATQGVMSCLGNYYVELFYGQKENAIKLKKNVLVYDIFEFYMLIMGLLPKDVQGFN